MVTLENWRTRMGDDMKLRDFRPRTQEGYMLAVRLFLDRMKREPETLTDDDVRAYFLYLREERKLAPSSINIAVHALRFFFVHTLGRDWPVFALLRVHKPRMLPVVLSTGEVRSVLNAIRHPVRRMALTTIYALGLRLGEGLRLETGHIDSARKLVWVRDGKGAKDRAVPLPAPLLARLRDYGSTSALPRRPRICSCPRTGKLRCTRPRFRRPSPRHAPTPTSRRTPPSIRFVTATPRICSRARVAPHHPASARIQVHAHHRAVHARDAAGRRAAAADFVDRLMADL